MTDLEYKGKIEIGKIEITGKSKDGKQIVGHEIEVKLDGRKIPYLQYVDVHLTATGKATVLMKFMPVELDIKLDDAEIFVRRKEEHATDS